VNEAFGHYFCPRCQRERLTANPVPAAEEFFQWATLGLVPVALALLRHFALPVRCTVCFGPLRASWAGDRQSKLLQSPHEIDALLSIFDSRTRAHSEVTQELASRELVEAFVVHDRGYMHRLKQDGFAVGGRHERVLHVARIFPEYLLHGYIARFFFLLFLPVTWLNVWYRRSKNPHAQFFPLDYHRAGRVVLTDHRLVIYQNMSAYYYGYCSIPYRSIHEIRQYQSSLRVQLKSGERRTLTVYVGQDIGALLRAIHELTRLPLRDPDRHWQASGSLLRERPSGEPKPW
jgi:hypothetical protein